MAAKNERVTEMVHAELEKNPQVGNDVLMKQAVGIDSKIKKMSPRAFHATYRLPWVRAAKRAARPAGAPAVKKTRGPNKRGRPAAAPAAEASSAPAAAPRSAPTGRRGSSEIEAVRQVLHSVATEALRADDRASFIRVLDSLDSRAHDLLAIFGR